MSVAIHRGPQDGPDCIGPETSAKRSFGERIHSVARAFTTKNGLVGNYDYGIFKL